MSEAVSRFVSMALPDAVEVGAKLYSRPTDDAPRTRTAGVRVRKPRQPNQPAFGKQENSVDVINPKPEDIQAGLDATLAKYVDAQPTAIKRAETLIKIGQYQVELSKYAPMLVDADPETALETLGEWFGQGDADLKKSLFNAFSGSEDLVVLAKAAPEEGPEHDLARMFDALPDGAGRMALLQKMQIYGTQLHEMTSRGELLKVDPDVIEAAIVEWIETGDDGSHRDLKKALADVDREARRTATASPGENELSDQKAGNAASHTASKLSGQNDRTYGARPTGEGAGANLRGTAPVHGSSNDEGGGGTSGPNDTGEGGVTPSVTIRRKGTTGGLGTVTPEEEAQAEADPKVKKAKKKKIEMDKSGDLALELVKVAPQDMISALNELEEKDQIEICQIAAQDAADLMAWSAQTGDTLQKSALDSAVADWLTADPDSIQLKKWVAEALASAEEIPLTLAKAIMEYEVAPPAPAVRVRRPSYAGA